VVIGRHFIHSRPAASRIHLYIGERGHPVHGSSKYLFDKPVIEVCPEPVGLFRVGPRQKKARPFRPEVKAARHIDHHREARRKLIERFGLNDLAAERLHGYIDSREPRNTGGPRTTSVDHRACGHETTGGLNTSYVALIDVDSSHFGFQRKSCPALPRAF
jgi:hypothetical protein